MMIDSILSSCNDRFLQHSSQKCQNCSYEDYCPSDCEKCLKYIHSPRSAPNGSPQREYDCKNMADFYTCKYSCRYSSEIIYALKRLKDLTDLEVLRVLSFGCGPCSDLFSLDYLHSKNVLKFNQLEYRGVDYSENVWKNIHGDIEAFNSETYNIRFYYQNACDLMNEIVESSGTPRWTPNLVIFQYVFSDMHKHTGSQKTKEFQINHMLFLMT
jgi:hypothetical protein